MGEVIHFPLGGADRRHLDAMIARLAADRRLSPQQLERVCANIWTAWQAWGEHAGLVEMRALPLPSESAQYHAHYMAGVHDAARQAMEAYRAAVVLERLELEIRLAKTDTRI